MKAQIDRPECQGTSFQVESKSTEVGGGGHREQGWRADFPACGKGAGEFSARMDRETHTRANTKCEVRVLIEFFVRPGEPEDSVE